MLNKDQINFLKKHVKGIVWHWSAGTYNNISDHYHFNITYDGKLGHLKQTKSLYEVGEHVWYRNTGLIGIAVCAMYTDPKTGKVICPVEDHQVEVMARATAELCYILDLDPEGTYSGLHYINKGNYLVPSGDKLQCPVLADHAWYAKQDKYFPDRWDIGTLEPVVRRKALWYYSKLKDGTYKVELLKDVR